MDNKPNTRREFLKTTSAIVACAALGDGEAIAGAASRPAGTVTDAKILNYNPKMGYRPLGRTGVMISEISLGGHGGKTPEDRTPVLERAIELGINYLDNNMVEECALYAKSMGDRRKHFYIGFASWPERLTTDWEKDISKEGLQREIEARLKVYRTERLDMWRPIAATWGPGQTKRETLLGVSPRVLDTVVEVFDKVHRDGKVRWLGISAHNDKVFRLVLEKYPQFSVILFPYLFLTKPQGGDSLLALAEQKGVGVICIKPFAAGATFGFKPTEFNGKLDIRASVLLKAMLAEKRISAVIPGVNNVEQLEQNIKGSHERDKALSESDRQALRECEANFHAHLTPDYQWLHCWKTV